MLHPATIDLQPYFFTELEKKIISAFGMQASTFRYSSGVDALRLSNQVGHLILLPYQGQQIWHAEFFGRPLTMKSMFSAPNPTQVYLETYGAFLIHCGALRMGVPGEKDQHPLHGELPNAPYQQAQIVLGQDERGEYIGLTGSYQYTVAFNHNYIAQPLVKLYSNSSRFTVSLSVKNLKKTPMDLMYLAHVNFRPVNNGELVYSAHCSPKTVRVRSSIPSHITPPTGYREFLQEVEAHPEIHHILKPNLAFDPEVVFFIDYLADDTGWAHTMQMHPNGEADFISHRPTELGKGVRWISRTPDQDALGMNLAATAEPEGYSAEKAKGNIQTIPAEGEFMCHMEMGALSVQEAELMKNKIKQMLSQK